MTKKQKQISKTNKPQNVKVTLNRLALYLKPDLVKLFIIALFAVLSTIFTVLSPRLLGDATTLIFESVTEGQPIDFNFLTRLLTFLIFLYFFASFFNWSQQYLMAGVSQRAVAKIRKDVHYKLSHLPVRYFDEHPYGDLLSRAINDVDNINQSFQQGLAQLITSLVTVVGIILMMLTMSPILTLVILIIVPLSFYSIKKIVSYSQKHFKEQQDQLGKLNGHIEEMYTGHTVVKAYNYEGKSIKKFDEINESLYKSSHKARFISGIMSPLMNFIGNLGFVFVSIVGAFLVLTGFVTIGNVQAFIQYSKQVQSPMQQVASVAVMVQNALASAERIFILLDEQEETEETPLGIDLNHLSSTVYFDGVSFGYSEEELLMKKLNFKVYSGQKVAIVGPTGAGKTTLINLLLRYYDIQSGRILVGEQNIYDLSRQEVRSLFSVVSQDAWLFTGTIYENIAYGKTNATRKEVVKAAQRAYADGFIRKLPNGYETVLNQSSADLSQGQRQLLTIARALVADPKILILDEATSHVDTRTELAIQNAMDELMKGRTSFVIAHRLSTIQDADLILVMNQGDIIEKGKHEELLEKGCFYADLYYSQFDQESEDVSG